MKFWLEKISTQGGWGSEEQPHPKAVREDYMCGETAPGRKDQAPFKGWVVELNSMEELVKLANETGLEVKLDTSIWLGHPNREPYPTLIIIDGSEE